MTTLTWLTDIHLNFLDEAQRDAFYQTVLACGADAVAVTGDIGEAPDVAGLLEEMSRALRRPVYFVLGNHDFYQGSIAQTRREAADLAGRDGGLTYLTASGAVSLTQTSALIGHDGWADGRLGDLAGSDVMLNDYFLIEELAEARLRKPEIAKRLAALGDEAAARMREDLTAALQSHRRVILLTHVPPFREATWHEGQLSDDHWMPHFSCKAAGEAMVELMRQHPDRDLLVLCGHTHGAGEARILPNLRVLTGGAEYGSPVVQQVLKVE